ncbi:hypothetical protein JRG78_01110 [Microbacterium sp. EF45047]|nr:MULTISPECIES: hypothetical protein [Microbacterium]UWF77711.1 hypothetical protein JSY13_01100 [Microbacterium neungamense]WCM55880.1 hypothetical protein JRG78_01110 [Microbacterium sp. EF45047]
MTRPVIRQDRPRAEAVHEHPAEDRADDGADHDRGVHEAGHQRVEAELLLDGRDAEGEGGEVVGVHEDAAQGEDDDRLGPRALRSLLGEQGVHVAGGADDGRRGDGRAGTHGLGVAHVRPHYGLS